MHLGIFAKTFPRPTLDETLDSIADRGLTHVQFNRMLERLKRYRTTAQILRANESSR